jgi:hypothetical protein
MQNRDGIFKLFRSPEIESKESTPPAYVASGPVQQPYSYSLPSDHRSVLKFQHSDHDDLS